MKRRLLLTAFTLLTLAFPVAAHADLVDDMVQILSQQGYDDIEVTRTLLGRTRILATNEQGTRELVINPRTGEVLRDIWTNRNGENLPLLLSGTLDDEDDDDAEDNSGPGGGGDDDDRSGHGHSGDDCDDGDDD